MSKDASSEHTDEWSALIRAAKGRSDPEAMKRYAQALQAVEAREDKQDLIDLVYFLLVEREEAAALLREYRQVAQRLGDAVADQVRSEYRRGGLQ